MALIQRVDFNKNAPSIIKKIKYGENWPVVYLINNKEEMYVGETVNVSVRTSQHLKNPDREKLTSISIISDDDFNKSVVLDLEAHLISYMAADGKYKLQNSTMGMQLHNYYNREVYEKSFSQIWNQLKEQDLATNTIHYIENSDIFKYSPYKSLSLDQYKVIDEVIQNLVDSYQDGKGTTSIIMGGAGTGKTVLAVYLMKLFAERNNGILIDSAEMDPGLNYIIDNLNKLPVMKIGLVVPMQSLRSTISKVFKSVHGLQTKMVISPIQVPKEEYDLLIVDEAHRLRQRKALAQYPTFDKNNKKLGLDNTGTELDWILKCSKNQILFYDSTQSIKPSDVDKEAFDELVSKDNTKIFKLESQFRCKGGNDYIDYVKAILSNDPPAEAKSFGNYDIKLFDDVTEMINAIKEKDKEIGLCRTVAGYSWKWLSKNDNTVNDIIIGNTELKWNSVNKDWVNSENSINEIGCIHTIQGYDLNYAGVIFGNEIKYDPANDKIIIDKSEYHDLQGKTALKDEDELKEYILNIYRTLMTRGIRGTYVYVCNGKLRDYLRTFI